MGVVERGAPLFFPHIALIVCERNKRNFCVSKKQWGNALGSDRQPLLECFKFHQAPTFCKVCLLFCLFYRYNGGRARIDFAVKNDWDFLWILIVFIFDNSEGLLAISGSCSLTSNFFSQYFVRSIATIVYFGIARALRRPPGHFYYYCNYEDFLGTFCGSFIHSFTPSRHDGLGPF